MAEETKKYTVSFEVLCTEKEMDVLDNVNLSVLAADAFAEFSVNRCRGNAEAYVEERYAGSVVYVNRNKKVQEVILRNQVATLFHGGALRGVTVKESLPEGKVTRLEKVKAKAKK
jgi:hypothetical protein